MWKVLIWGIGNEYAHFINLIKWEEDKGNIKVIGVTSNETEFMTVDGYQFIEKSALSYACPDFIIIASSQYAEEIRHEVHGYGWDPENCVNLSVFALPGFDFVRYIQLFKSNISIISNNCWGGLTYHSLGLRFTSPFINMWIGDEDYIKLLQRLPYYLRQKLQLERWSYNPELEIRYPVVRLGDILIHFNHSSDFDQSVNIWERRLQRLNMQCLFVEMYTESRVIAQKFNGLDFKNKVIFVPFYYGVDTAIEIRTRDSQESGAFFQVVNAMASGKIQFYNPVELLLQQKPAIRVKVKS